MYDAAPIRGNHESYTIMNLWNANLDLRLAAGGHTVDAATMKLRVEERSG